MEWKFYRLKFSQPIDYEEVTRFCMADLSARSQDDLAKLFLLAREGVAGDAMSAFHEHRRIVNAYTIANVALSEPVVGAIRKEMRRLFPDVRVENEAIVDLLMTGVLKREVVEGDRAVDAKDRIKKANGKLTRAAAKKAPAAPAALEEA